MSAHALLTARDPAPFVVHHADGTSPFLLTCDHAGRRVPERLGDLGLPASDLQRHIAWDIGAQAMATVMAEALDAWLICQTYSRLVIDCNRPLTSLTSIPTRSEDTDIPGNGDLDQAAIEARRREIFQPYHQRTVEEFERREREKRPTLLVTAHSFTPVYLEQARPWQVAMLYQRDARLAHAMLEIARAEGRWCVGDNQPYAPTDTSEYAVPVHGEGRSLPHVEIEVRQDLLSNPAGQREWGERLARWLPLAAQRAGLI